MTPLEGSDTDSGPVKVGDLFQGYQIIKLLGRGGYASVYHARREFIGRDVAIKISNRSVTREVFKRFQAEARFTRSLEHPNIVKVDDADMAGGHLYIVMELLRGQTFWDARKQYGKLTVPEALHLCAQVADGVEQAHRAGAIHRDLKPLNLFIVAGNQPKVLDFGIAKIPDDGDGSSTQRNIVHGTLKYMSADQLMGKKLTPRSDIYALGVIFFELITGQHPHIAENAQPTEAELGFAIVSQSPSSLAALDPNIPSYIIELVDRAFSRDREKQFASMAEFANAARESYARYVREFPALSELRELWIPAANASAVVRSAPPADQELIATAIVAAVSPQSLRPTVRFQSKPEDRQQVGRVVARPHVASTPAPAVGGVSVSPREGSNDEARPLRTFSIRRVVLIGAAVGLTMGMGLTLARLRTTSSPLAAASATHTESTPASLNAVSAVTSASSANASPAPSTIPEAPTASVAQPVLKPPASRQSATTPQSKARRPGATDKKIADRINWYDDEPRGSKQTEPKSGL